MPLTTDEFRDRFPKLTQYIKDNEVNALISKLKYSSIGENKNIIVDDQENDCLYFVMDGQLDCYIQDGDRKISIGKIFPGEYIGEVSMLDGLPSTSSVKTETRCTLYTLRRSAFEELKNEHPVIAGKVLRSISSLLINRLRSADKLLFDGIAEQQASTNNHLSNREWFVKIYQLLH